MMPRKRVRVSGDPLSRKWTRMRLSTRHPQVAVVDEFPHRTFPDSRVRNDREDVQAILETRLHVLTTMNVQHLDSLEGKWANSRGKGTGNDSRLGGKAG